MTTPQRISDELRVLNDRLERSMRRDQIALAISAGLLLVVLVLLALQSVR